MEAREFFEKVKDYFLMEGIKKEDLYFEGMAFNDKIKILFHSNFKPLSWKNLKTKDLTLKLLSLIDKHDIFVNSHSDSSIDFKLGNDNYLVFVEVQYSSHFVNLPGEKEQFYDFYNCFNVLFFNYKE